MSEEKKERADTSSDFEIAKLLDTQIAKWESFSSNQTASPRNIITSQLSKIELKSRNFQFLYDTNAIQFDFEENEIWIDYFKDHKLSTIVPADLIQKYGQTKIARNISLSNCLFTAFYYRDRVVVQNEYLFPCRIDDLNIEPDLWNDLLELEAIDFIVFAPEPQSVNQVLKSLHENSLFTNHFIQNDTIHIVKTNNKDLNLTIHVEKPYMLSVHYLTKSSTDEDLEENIPLIVKQLKRILSWQ